MDIIIHGSNDCDHTRTGQHQVRVIDEFGFIDPSSEYFCQYCASEVDTDLFLCSLKYTISDPDLDSELKEQLFTVYRTLRGYFDKELVCSGNLKREEIC